MPEGEHVGKRMNCPVCMKPLEREDEIKIQGDLDQEISALVNGSLDEIQTRFVHADTCDNTDPGDNLTIERFM